MKEAYESLGFTVVHEATYNILGEANWAPFAAAVEEAGVTFLTFVGEGENLALLPAGAGRDRLRGRGHPPGRQLL